MVIPSIISIFASQFPKRDIETNNNNSIYNQLLNNSIYEEVFDDRNRSTHNVLWIHKLFS